MVQRSGAVVVLRLIICATIVPFIMARAAEAQLLNSWEGSTEGWNSQNGAVLVNSASRPGGAKGVTDGTDSLAVTLPNQGYLRWGDRVLEGAALDAVVAAAGSETGIGVVEFDVTYDTSEIPQGTVTYVNHQLAMQTNAGWSQVDITAPTYPQTNGSTDETAHFLLPLSLFGSLSGTSTSVQMLFAASGDWGDGQQATLFYDNLRVSALEPDLNNDNVVNVLDWEIFIEMHLDLSYCQ